MGRVFDEADYRRRLDDASTSNYGLAEELKLIISGQLEARKNMDLAKQNALRKARKNMLKAIRDEDQKMRDSHMIPTEVEEITTGAAGDELVKV